MNALNDIQAMAEECGVVVGDAADAARRAKVHATIRVGGAYKLVARKAVNDSAGNRVPGPITRETPWCKNVATLNYFNLMLASPNALYYRGCVVGTGNSAPDETDTALDTYLAATTTRQATEIERNYTVSPRFNKIRLTWRFGEGVAEGNVAEVGVVIMSTNGGSVDGSAPLGSRALVVDGGGSPTVIPVQADEFLDVIWDCYWYVPEDVSGTVSLDIDGVPTDHDFTIRGAYMASSNSHGGWGLPHINPINPSPRIVPSTSGNSWNNGGSIAYNTQSLVGYDVHNTSGDLAAAAADSNSASAYSAGSKTRTFTFKWSLNKGNLGSGGIGSIGFLFNWGAFQMSLDPRVDKVNTKVFEIDMTVTLANV